MRPLQIALSLLPLLLLRSALGQEPPKRDRAALMKEGATASRIADELIAEGRIAEAVVPLKKAKAIANEVLPGSLTAGICSAKLGDALERLGKRESALQSFDDAIRILETVLPHKDPNLSLLIDQKLGCLVALGREKEARQVIRALLQRAHTEKYSLPAEVIARAHDMANQLSQAGDLVGAAMLFEDSIAAVEAMQGPNASSHRFQALDDLAALYERADLPTEELAALKKMLASAPNSAQARCGPLMRAASAAVRAGSAREGQTFLDQSWACVTSDDADWLAWISFQFSRLGHPGLAQRVADRALSEKKKLSGAAKARLFHSIAIAQLVELDGCAAVVSAGREFALLKSLGDKSSSRAAASDLLSRADRMCRGKPITETKEPDGDPNGRLKAARDDLAQAEKKYDASSQSVLARRMNLGLEYYRQNQIDDACREFGAVAMQFAKESLFTAAESSRAAQLSQQRGFGMHVLDALVSACRGAKGAAMAEPLLFLKGQVLEGVRQEALLTRLSVVPGQRELVLRLRSTRAQIARALLGAVSGEELAAATETKEQLERQLSVPAASILEPLGVIGGLAGLRRSLNADEAYVDLTVYRAMLAPTHDMGLVALVLTRDSASVIDLGRLDAILRSLDDWLTQIADWKSDGARPLARLRTSLIQPILHALPKDVSHLIVSPDALLSGAPWQHPALTSDRYSVWLVPSARELVRYKLAATGSPLQLAGRMAILHQPDFDAGEGVLVDEISRLFPIPLPSGEPFRAPRGLAVDDLSGRLATRARLVSALGKAAILHIESHGVFLDAMEDRRRLARNAFAASAIAVAGANRRDRLDGRLGVVSAEELVGVAGPELQLATLASCDSAKGASVPGQGSLGLATALATVGTPTIIASAWHASLESSRALFGSFYSRLAVSKDPREAFDRALAALRASTALQGARHWAGWQFLGYSRASASPTLRMSRMVYDLCACRSGGDCGFSDPSGMDELKRILSAPNVTKEDEAVIVDLIASLKQCQRGSTESAQTN